MCFRERCLFTIRFFKKNHLSILRKCSLPYLNGDGVLRVLDVDVVHPQYPVADAQLPAPVCGRVRGDLGITITLVPQNQYEQQEKIIFKKTITYHTF